MSLDIQVDLAKYPDLTVSQTPDPYHPKYSLHIPMKDIPKVLGDILNMVPGYEKAKFSIADKISVAKNLGLDYVYRGPDLARTCLFTAGFCLMAAGLAEEKILKQAVKALATFVASCAPSFAQNSYVQGTLNIGSKIQDHKLFSGAALVLVAHGSNLVSESTAESFHGIRRGVRDVFKSAAKLLGFTFEMTGKTANGLANGFVKAKDVSVNAFTAYTNAWENQPMRMMHAHAFAGVGAIFLAASRKA